MNAFHEAMGDSDLTYNYEAITDLYKVTLTRNGYSAACWVDSVEMIEERRGELQAAIDRMEADSLARE